MFCYAEPMLEGCVFKLCVLLPDVASVSVIRHRHIHTSTSGTVHIVCGVESV